MAGDNSNARSEVMNIANLNGINPAVILRTKFHDNKEILVEMRDDADAIDIARRVSDEIGADHIKYRWIARVLQHGLMRPKEQLVQIHDIYIDGGIERLEIEVHYGDDLFLVAHDFGLNYGLDHSSIQTIYENLVLRTPQHSSCGWISKRKNHDIEGNNIAKYDTHLPKLKPHSS
eukprot:9832800-Ditylum_brightwellii.AAC.1